MNKRKIGKLQLIIGIIVLVIGLGGVVASIIWFNDTNQKFYPWVPDQTCEGCSEAEITIITYEVINLRLNQWSNMMHLISSLGTVSILFILISLLFITQGLLNMSEIR